MMLNIYRLTDIRITYNLFDQITLIISKSKSKTLTDSPIQAFHTVFIY